MTGKCVYLDNNATTMVAPEVVEEMLPLLKEYYGNPSSLHTFGAEIGRYITMAKERIAGFLVCSPAELVFTSCGTESNNTVIKGIADSYPDKRHIITSNVEHPAVREPCKYLAKKGYRLTELSVDKNGNLDIEELRHSITDDTVLVSIMYANNESGVIFPIEEIGRIVKERGILFHVDSVQAVGKIPINLSKSTIDFLSISGHKIHAPKGVGVLYIRQGVRLHPFMLGGHQENGRRGGTEAVHNIVALGKAVQLIDIVNEGMKTKSLRDRLEKGIMENIPETRINGDQEKRLPNTTNIGFRYVEGDALLISLSNIGVHVSTGAACTPKSLSPSHVLKAMKVPFDYANGSIRFSFSRYNNENDVDYVLENLPAIIQRLRDISPVKRKK